ncbi:MAG: hypothetical protein V3U65_07505 [Granulosicoccaceae bacterium]
MRIFRTFATAVAIPILLSACSSDSSSPADTGGSTGGTTGSTTGDTSGTTFFNDADGISFANTIGSGFSNALDAVLSGVGSGGSIASASNLSQRLARATDIESTACDGGGTIAVSSTVDDTTAEVTDFGLTFNSCNSGGVLSTGGVSFTISGAAPTQAVTMNFDNFASLENGESNSINGTVSIALSNTNGVISTTVSGTSITMVTGGETITYSNYNLMSGQDSAGNSSISGAATIATSSDGTLMMSINPALVTGASDYPETGTILLSHSDGSSLTINADTGDASTYSYIISDGVSTTSNVGNWSDTDIGEIEL